MLKQYHLRDFRLRLVIYVFANTILGILLVGSADAEYQNQQILGMVLGTGAMLVLALIDYRIWMNLYCVIYAVNLVLLLAVHFFGDSSGGAKRWLDLGIRFQPSELTKLALILFLAHFFTKYREELNSWKMILISLILVGAPLFLVYEQPNLSTTLMIAMVFCILIFAGGLSYKIVGGILVVLVPSVLIFFTLIMQEGQTILRGYQLERIMAWLNPEAYPDIAYQQLNSIIAVGSGQLYGKGLYNTDPSSVKNGNYIIEPQTDFIFAVAGEELGFIGCATIILLLTLIVIE